MKRIGTLFTMFLGLVAVASLASAQASKIDPRVRIALGQLRAGTPVSQIRTANAAVAVDGMLDVFIRGDVSRAELEAQGVIVRTELPGLYTAYVPATLVDVLAANPRVSSIRGAVQAEQTLNVSVPATGADVLRGAAPAFAGFNGSNILVGDVDSGIDIHHGDFKEGGLTRIQYLWDQTAGASPPSGFAIGTEWTKAQIDGGTCTEVDNGTIASGAGHGTHVMGIAAGNGSQTGGAVPAYTYVGMAPKADIAMVKTTFSTTDILDGVNWIYQKAAALGKLASVNLSLGSEFGPHDGTSDFESGLSALVGPGKILSVAAGNDRGTNWHAGFSVPAGGDSVKFTVTSTTNLALGNPTAAIDGYYNSPDNFTVTLRSPTGAIVGPITMGNINAAYPGTLLTGSANVYIENGAFLTPTGAREVYIEVTRTSSTHPVAGVWTAIFTPVALTNGRVDMWKFYSGAGTTVFSSKNTNDHLVSEPGNAFNVISVAAWETKNSWTDCGGRAVSYSAPAPLGAIATFSGIGPTRDGRNKPDIAAPGMGIGSTRSFDATGTCGTTASALLNDASNHIINQGTSMAAPHVTGAVALLLQKYGAWTPAQITSYLFTHAIVDANTGSVWNNSFGMGKLHLGDLFDPTVTVLSPNGGENLLSGTSANLTWNAADNVGVTSVDVLLSRSGPAGPFTTIVSGYPNSGSLAWLVTTPATTNAYLRVVAHDAENNTGADLSDQSFTIVDAATATLLASFVANPIDRGIELRWQIGDPTAFQSVQLARASSSAGPWEPLSLALTDGADGTTAVDAAATSGTTYWYRLTGVTRQGQTVTLGTISGTAGAAVTQFAITHVSPNPTHGMTNIEFTVPRQSDVRISVMDVVGREVATLTHGTHSAGRYQVMWTGEVKGGKAPAGLYFIRMQAPGVVATHRAVIAR